MIFALERLRALRADSSYGVPDDGPTTPDDLSMDWRIEYEERAAILEYDGGLSREAADIQAFNEIKERMRYIDEEKI